MARNRSATLVATLALIASSSVALPAAASGLAVADLTTSLTPTALAEQLAGTGVSVSNVQYTGAPAAAGSFTGGDGIIGFDTGIILSSGQATDVVGPNASPSTTTAFGEPGDPDLTELAGVPTNDAAILAFDFVPDADRIFFQYVFGSEEYNEYVSAPLTGVNDVFGFFINGVNCATVPNPGDPSDPYPVTITTVNNGQPGVPPVNPDLYINNDPFSADSTGDVVATEDLLDTQMDGLTVVLTCEIAVTANETNTMRLAIADGGDSILDSWVLLQAGSLTTDPDPDPDPEPGTVEVSKVWIDADGSSVSSETPDGVTWAVSVTAGSASYELDASSPSVSFEALPGTALSITEAPIEGYARVVGEVSVGDGTLTCVGDAATAEFDGEEPLALVVCNKADPDPDPDPEPIVCATPAAPAWAAHILKANGQPLQYAAAPAAGHGKGKGGPPAVNLVASVAQAMSPGTDFAGVSKDNQAAYGDAVRVYLEGLTGWSLALPADWPPDECEEATNG
jgi:hypothetical protein